MQISKAMVVTLSLLCVQLACAAEPQKDIGVSTSAEIDFIHGTAKFTALAPTRLKNAVKFIALGLDSAGTVVVTAMAVGIDHGASFKPPADASAVAHVHHRDMPAKLEAADYLALRVLGLPCFVISADGEAIWEIAVLGGVSKYRPVLPSHVGEWVEL
ncbi:MAG: hypothetical protein V4633_21165 [Pseudomonadota bacterium]